MFFANVPLFHYSNIPFAIYNSISCFKGILNQDNKNEI